MAKRAVATKKPTALSDDLLDEVAGQGLGYSEKAEDSLIPILGILQDNSGEVKKKHERHMDGAEPGMLIVRSLAKLFVAEGDKAISFQPCAFGHMWIEWSGEPGEGAVVNQYDFDDGVPSEAEQQALDPQNPERLTWVMPTGNRLVETRYHYGHILLEDDILPVVIPFAGTNHTVSRAWTAQMKQFRVPGRSQKLPSFFRHYALETMFTQRGNQSWYKFKVTDNGMLEDESIIRAGLEFLKSVQAGDVTAGSDDESSTAEDDDNIPV